MPDYSKGFSPFWLELKKRKVLRSLAIYAGMIFLSKEPFLIDDPRLLELLDSMNLPHPKTP